MGSDSIYVFLNHGSLQNGPVQSEWLKAPWISIELASYSATACDPDRFIHRRSDDQTIIQLERPSGQSLCDQTSQDKENCRDHHDVGGDDDVWSMIQRGDFSMTCGHDALAAGGMGRPDDTALLLAPRYVVQGVGRKSEEGIRKAGRGKEKKKRLG